MQDDNERDVLAEASDEHEELEGLDEGELNATLSQNISLEKADRSLSELKRWFDDGDLVIDPEWQRNYVWSKRQASKLIESFLLNIPVPVVYLARTENDQYEVIDGLQRLKSVFNFLNNEFPLSGLDVLTTLNGKKFKVLDGGDQRKLKNSTLRSFELSSTTEKDIHFVVFERLNTGGTKLNDMEIRNCIFRGKLNDLIKSLAGSSDFTKCINQKSLSKRMNDRALVLRFLAFYERTHSKCTQGLKKFSNEFLQTYQNPTPQKLSEYRRVFEKCMKVSTTVFGEYGFRLRVSNSRKSKSVGEWATRVNAAIFQCIATSFSSYDIGQLTRNADAIYEEYIDLITMDEEWIDCVRRATGESTRLNYVFDTWRERLSKIMDNVPANDGKRMFSRNLKNELFNQDKTCSICGQEIKLLDDAALDHEKHYWRGGATVPENARLTHRFCNLSRGSG